MPQKRNPIASEYILAATRTVQALVPVMLGAMAQDHERATGPWQGEALALPQAFVLTHGALLHARTIAEGIVVDPQRMRQNLDLTHGLIVAEAVMMGLAPLLGRGEAHHVVKHACDIALAERLPLADVLVRDPAVSSRLDRAAIERMTEPASYLGSALTFVDRVLAAAAAVLAGATDTGHISQRRRPGLRLRTVSYRRENRVFPWSGTGRDKHKFDCVDEGAKQCRKPEVLDC